MKTNFFGEKILQPGDDIGALFAEQFDAEPEDTLTASDIEHEPDLGWTCLIRDEGLNEAQAHDFETEAALREWLTKQGVEIDG
jgi:hypothetical protein